MASGIQNELNDIANDLQSIINELSDIAQGVGADFKNVGNERCAQVIESVKDQYIGVRNDIRNI